MNKRIKTLCLALTSAITITAQTTEKEIYIPRDLRHIDFASDTAQWSYNRMAKSPNFVVFWEKGFGNDLSNPPALEGHDMKVNLQHLLDRLESFYAFYKDTLGFVKPGSKSERYRMMAMLNYSLEGTAYGGDYDQTIGALWIAPNRLQDKRLNCIAHEIGHSFQSQIACDGTGESWGGGGIFEMASQWMLWNVNPEWTTDENYHWEAFRRLTYKRFLDISNIYHSPYVLEYWSTRRGLGVIADLFREGKRGEDPASTYMRMFGLTIDEMNCEMAECYSRLITFDFPIGEASRKYSCQLKTATELQDGKWMRPVAGETPETWGFNVIEIPEGKKSGKATVECLNTSANATLATRMVYVGGDKQLIAYGDIQTGSKQTIKYRMPKEAAKAYLVVVGCPKQAYSPYLFNPYDEKSKKEKADTYPYRIKL